MQQAARDFWSKLHANIEVRVLLTHVPLERRLNLVAQPLLLPLSIRHVVNRQTTVEVAGAAPPADPLRVVPARSCCVVDSMLLHRRSHELQFL